MYIGLSILSALLIPGIFLAFIDILTILLESQQILLFLCTGFGIGMVLYITFFRRRYYILNFEHEITHAFMALLFLRRIHSFRSGNDGGYIFHSDGFGGEIGNIVIRLAPYSLPTFTFISAIFRPLIPHEWFPYYDIFIGLTLGYHTLSNAEEIRQNFHKRSFFYAGTNTPTLSDIGQTGYILSAILIVLLTLLFHSILFSVIIMDYEGVTTFLNVAWDHSERLYFSLRAVLKI